MSSHSSFRFVRTAVSVFALSCAGFAASAQQAQPAVSAVSAAASNDVNFPSLDSSYLKTGSFVGPDHVRRITPGLSKDQVRLELGNPQYSEGLFGVREWDYAFNFYTGKGNEYITCQFKVKFDLVDNVYRAVSTHWKGVACESYLNPVVMAQAVPVVLAAPAPAPTTRRLTLGADGLFKFAKSGFNDLLPEGRGRLEALATQLRRDGVVLSSIIITGHTDRIGSDASNVALSQARANTVRDYLVGKGIDSKLVRAYGAGETQPVQQCAGERVTPELVACLQPNRRVDIEVAGQQ
jgi:OOP family OmpA-OmpF porin